MFINYMAREHVVKVVYDGPPGAGKGTILRSLHTQVAPEVRGKVQSYDLVGPSQLFFELLPRGYSFRQGFTLRLQIYAVSGAVFDRSTLKLQLKGADGVIFVADSQVDRRQANEDSLASLRENLSEQGRSLDEMPLVFQHNKRDLPDLLPLDQMEAQLNPRGRPSVPSIASRGEGAAVALQALIEQMKTGILAPHLLAPSPG